MCSFLHKHNEVQPLGAEPLSGCLCLLTRRSAGCLFSGRGTERAHKAPQNRACLQGQSHGCQAHTFLQGPAKCVFLCSKIKSYHTCKLILEYALLMEAHCFFFNTVTMHLSGILKNPGEFLILFLMLKSKVTGMAATGKTNSTASLSHKYKPSCKYHSGDHQVFEQILVVSRTLLTTGSTWWVTHAKGRIHALAPHTSHRKVKQPQGMTTND